MTLLSVSDDHSENALLFALDALVLMCRGYSIHIANTCPCLALSLRSLWQSDKPPESLSALSLPWGILSRLIAEDQYITDMAN